MIQYSQLQLGDDVVVIGVGGIGLLCLMVARAAGAGRLIAVDPSQHTPGKQCPGNWARPTAIDPS